MVLRCTRASILSPSCGSPSTRSCRCSRHARRRWPRSRCEEAGNASSSADCTATRAGLDASPSPNEH
eukprot:751089-Pleurochrysis_carterae.AAC.2